jgi:soluble lytic murein transglycosylase-like protein
MAVCLVALCHADPIAADSGHTPPPLGPIIVSAAARAGIPAEVLAAVIWVESGRWPWALNVGGRPVYPRSRTEAAVWLRAVSGRADIGLAQIHYPVWGPVFGLRPEDLLDPWTNLHVAARILRDAMDQEPGSWGGVGRYHSATPWRKWRYARHVATVVRALRAPALQPDRAPAP